MIIELAKATAMTLENGSQRDSFSVAKFDSLCKKSKIVWNDSCTREETPPYQAEHKALAKSEGKLPEKRAVTGVPMGPRSISSLRASQMWTESVFFWPHSAACGILIPWPGIEPVPLVLQEQSLNHWTSREVLGLVRWNRVWLSIGRASVILKWSSKNPFTYFWGKHRGRI